MEQCFKPSQDSCIVSRIIEMKSGFVFTSSLDTAVAIWNGDSTGEGLLNPAESTYKTMKLLSQEKLLPVQISTDKTFHVWNSKGECIETISTAYGIEAITTVGDLIVTANRKRFTVWQMK